MTDKLISDLGSIGAAIADNTAFEAQRNGQTTTEQALGSDLKTYVKSWIAKADVGLGNVTNNAQLTIANNLSDLNDAPTARNNLGGIFPPMDPDYNDANVYLTTPLLTSPSAGVFAANTMSFFPIWVPRTRTFTTYAIVVTALSASTGIRLGLYNSNSSLVPTSLIDQCSPIDTSTGTGSTGRKTAAFGVNQSLKPGLYFLASLSDGAPTALRVGAGNSPAMGTLFGTGGAVLNGAKYATQAYGSLPSDASALTYTTQATGSIALPLVGIR